LRELIDALAPQPAGHYLDGTGGGGGHDAALLERLGPDGRLDILDRDPVAIAALAQRFADCPNVFVHQGNFFAARDLLPSCTALDGVMLDLGVSSMQIDEADRGFSLHKPGALDMRMGPEGPSAAELVNSLPAEELRDLFRRWSDEKYAWPIAKAIVRARARQEIRTTLQLAETVAAAVPAAARRDGHPARKVFTALRIQVNGELEGLGQALEDLFDCLAPGGRLACISFSAMEDAVVKNAFRALTAGCICPPEFPVCRCGRTPRGRFPQKPLLPSPEEIAENPRSRSAKLRVIEKI
jgi:16S rRNA (cytosine1402-N4)-methyltransferase